MPGNPTGLQGRPPSDKSDGGRQKRQTQEWSISANLTFLTGVCQICQTVVSIAENKSNRNRYKSAPKREDAFPAVDLQWHELAGRGLNCHDRRPDDEPANYPLGHVHLVHAVLRVLPRGSDQPIEIVVFDSGRPRIAKRTARSTSGSILRSGTGVASNEGTMLSSVSSTERRPTSTRRSSPRKRVALGLASNGRKCVCAA